MLRMSGNMFILSPSLIVTAGDVARILNAMDAGFSKAA
jgi:hypothetical protein